jgi:hypothetical protein
MMLSSLLSFVRRAVRGGRHNVAVTFEPISEPDEQPVPRWVDGLVFLIVTVAIFAGVLLFS